MHWIKRYLLWFLCIQTGYGFAAQAQAGGAQDFRSGPINSTNLLNSVSTEFDSITAPIPDTMLYIRSISFEGNKITRNVIILRELPFKEGDSVHLKDLPELFTKGTTQLRNTSLFAVNDISITILQREDVNIDLKIKVKERWYVWPLPHLKPVDRNLNQWLFEKGANTSRLDYGVKLLYDNISGNRDKMRFYFITGYTKQLSLSYSRPFIDKNLKWGVNLDLAIGKNHEINYGTKEDKQQFLKDNDAYMRNFFQSMVEFTYRPALYTTHGFGIGYSYQRIADTIQKLNPNYFLGNRSRVAYPEMYYRLSYQNLDYIPYPTKGYAAEVKVGKMGVTKDMNLWYIKAKGMGSWRLGPKSFYSISALGSLKVPFKQPFYNMQLLGYGDLFLRGYEYYVIDGVAGGVINATIAKQLINFSIKPPILKKYTSRLIPLKVYGKIYGNTGYVHNPASNIFNKLDNRTLYGGGFGLDIITDYDFTLKLDFSFNQLGENGLYLQKKTLY